MGIEGKSPPVPEKLCPTDLEKLWKTDSEKFDFDELDHRTFPRAITYMVHGKKGTKAGDGGDGGKQGEAGRAGKIMVFELDQAAKLKTYENDGKCIELIQFWETCNFISHFSLKVQLVQLVKAALAAEKRLKMENPTKLLLMKLPQKGISIAEPK